MHISDFDSKIMRITGVISLYGKQRGPTIMQSSIYFFHNLLHILMLQQLMIFLFAKKYPLIFFKVQISTNSEKNILKFVVLSIALAIP